MQTITRYLGAAVVTAAALAVAGCSAPADKSSADTLSFERINVTNTYRAAGSAADFDSASDLSIQCAADLLMPVQAYGHDVSELRSTILSTALDTTGTDAAKLVSPALRRQAEDMGYAVTDTTIEGGHYDGLFATTGAVVCLSPTVLAYGITNSTYSPGAAHGIYGTTYVNYDLTQGRVFTLADIVTAEGMQKLPELLRTNAADMQGMIGATEITELPAGNNFYVNADNELVFVYRPLEIASYSQGQIAIPVEAYELSDLLTPYGSRLLLGN